MNEFLKNLSNLWNEIKKENLFGTIVTGILLVLAIFGLYKKNKQKIILWFHILFDKNIDQYYIKEKNYYTKKLIDNSNDTLNVMMKQLVRYYTDYNNTIDIVNSNKDSISIHNDQVNSIKSTYDSKIRDINDQIDKLEIIVKNETDKLVKLKKNIIEALSEIKKFKTNLGKNPLTKEKNIFPIDYDDLIAEIAAKFT